MPGTLAARTGPVMKRAFLLFLACCALIHTVDAQSTIRGKVTDAVTGEELIGASIGVKGSDPRIGTSANMEGNYSLTIPNAGPVTIAVSMFGYAIQETALTPAPGGVEVLNFELREEGKELREFEITRKANKRADAYLERMKSNAATSFDFISRDMTLKTGDSDASQAVRRVTGVSTVGAFVTVRGLADRYIVTAINGSRVPTMDPLTNNLRLDLFPTGLLDNIIITKTASPELPGDWSGAFMSLNTSDYPDKLRVSVSAALGYNPNVWGKQIVTAQSSSTDWLGRDDGMRGIPDGVPALGEDFPRFITPNLYQQLTLLGLGPTLTAYGITSTNSAFQSPTMVTNNALQGLALTELGLLAPALINDPTALQGAVNTYNSTYNLAYFSPTVNAELASLNTKFNNANWRVKEVSGTPNFNQSVTIGNQLALFKKRKSPMSLGYLAGFRYSKDTDYDGAATQERTSENFNEGEPGSTFDQQGDLRISTITTGWSALGSLSLNVDRNNSFSLLVMPNALGQNNARYTVFLKPSVSGETFASEDQFYEQRKLWVYQYGSKHFIPAWRMKVDLDGSYSDGGRDILDLKTVQYILPPPGEPITNVDGALIPASRIYRFLDETLLDARVGLELPLTNDDRKVRKLKFGGAYRNDTRTNQQTYFTILNAPGPTQWDDPGRFDLRPDGQFSSQYDPFGTFKDSDIGILKVWAGFVMADYAFNSKVRVVGGLRAEHTDLLTDILRYYEQGLDPSDPSRGTVGNQAIGGAGTAEPKPAVPGMIDQWDLLPSVNFIYRIKDDEQAPMNLRLNYFRSLGRPSFREFSVVQLFDFILNGTVYGNPELKMTNIDNFDVRVERFFKNRNNISLSGFYKRFNNHIELLTTGGDGYTWRNADFSRIYGLELEGRVGLTRSLEWRGNITVMDSRSDLTFGFNGQQRTFSTAMYGQAPYLVNSMLTWSADSARFYASVSYNVQGPKLAVSNSETAPETVRAYEMPRHLIDITLNKSVGEHWNVKLRGRNLLNSAQRRAYLFEKGYAVDFDSYRYGAEYSLVLTYTIE